MHLTFSRLAALAGGCALLAAGLPFLLAPPLPAPHDNLEQPQRAQQVRALNRQLSQQPARQLAAPGALPVSLQGASHGVHLQVDGQGNLQLQPRLLELFDFYFAAIDEEPEAQILLRIHNDLASQLQGAALAQARDLLKRYLEYRIALIDLPRAPTAPTASDLGQRLQDVAQLRGRYFSAQEQQAFFSAEDAQDQFMLAQLALGEQPLSASARRAALAELEARLPAEQRTVRQRVSQDGELYAETEAMRQAGASDEAIYQLRAQTLNAQAAEQLHQLDVQRREWQARLQAYAQARNQLRQSGLSPTDQQQAIAALQAERFDALERQRVQALDAEL